MEKCLASAVHQLSPAVGLRLVFESVASGILLPGTDDPMLLAAVSKLLHSSHLDMHCLHIVGVE